jgi:glycosidase
MGEMDRIREQLDLLYGDQSEQIWLEINIIINDFKGVNPEFSLDKFELTEKDAILITYGDQFHAPTLSHLRSLENFLANNLGEAVNWVHLLPFFPFSSDDGFSVIDYREVNPQIGTWEDIHLLSKNYSLMFDAVINHISRESDWFKEFQKGVWPYRDYFIEMDPSTDLSSIFRPRTVPLLSPVDTGEGKKYVWTTFSDDQIDLNFSNPHVLLEIIRLMLFYVENHSRLIRLDAIGYVWKTIGTTCLNLPQAHSIVKILRAVIDLAAPNTGLITETNVPHQENIKYFGDPSSLEGSPDRPPSGDEAQMVYQFSLAPLVLHTFHSGDVTALVQWVHTLSVPYQDTAFFNFIASHDGIGVMPAKGLISDEQIQALVNRTLLHGGQVSYKANSDGTESVYELNITLFDALNNPLDANPELDVKRFIASQAIMLSLAGVPGIYVHSLFGSRNCYSCLERTGRSRSINREKFNLDALLNDLSNPDNIHTKIFNQYKHLLFIRQKKPAFHPAAGQKIFDNHANIFMLLRTSLDNTSRVLCLVNITSRTQQVKIDLTKITGDNFKTCTDLISNQSMVINKGQLQLTLKAYQIQWLSFSQVDTFSK